MNHAAQDPWTPDPEAQHAQLRRVRERIEAAVLAYCSALSPPAQFHMEDLTAFVQARVPVAPDSPGRILRHLRQRKRLAYRVVNRKASLYELLPLREQLSLF